MTDGLINRGGTILYGLLIWVNILIFQGCSPRLLPESKKTTDQKQLTLEDIEKANLEFETFSAKIKVESDLFDKKNPLKGQLKIAKDSMIVVSLNLSSGFPVAKLFFTTDSFLLVDRINKTLEHGTYETFYKKYKYLVSYQLIQSVILGEVIKFSGLPEMDIVPVSEKDSDETLLSIRYQDDKINESYFISYWIQNSNRRINKVKMLMGGGIADIYYHEFYQELNSEVPHQIKLLLKNNNKSADFFIEMSKLQFDKKLKFSVKIPRKYE